MELNGSPDELIEKLRKTNDPNVKYQISFALEQLIPQLTAPLLYIYYLCGSDYVKTNIFDALQPLLGQLNPNQLMKLLPSMKEHEREGTIPYLYAKLNLLTGTQLTQLHEYCKKEDVREKISSVLYEKRKTISQEDLIFLAIESARAAPPEYHEILNQLLYNEKMKNSQPKTSCFGISVPFQLKCGSNKSSINTNSDQPIFHYFNAIDNQKHYVDIEGPFATLLKYGDISFEVIQTKLLLNKGATVYLSLPPSFNNSIEVGTVSAQIPICTFIYPFQKIGIVESIRIGLVVKDKEFSAQTVSTKEIIKHTQLSDQDPSDLITVCFGEIHQFKTKEHDTMLTLLEFACRRFNQNIDQFEIQDLHYRTYPNQTTFVDYQKGGGSSIVRLVRKNSWANDTPNPIFHSPIHNNNNNNNNFRNQQSPNQNPLFVLPNQQPAAQQNQNQNQNNANVFKFPGDKQFKFGQ